jgi:hypothetical protein
MISVQEYTPCPIGTHTDPYAKAARLPLSILI